MADATHQTAALSGKAKAAAKPLYAARDFNDAGTGKSFEAGDDVSAEPGAGNYAAAGLASEQKPDAA